MCDKGKKQSPINLSLRGAVKGIYDKLEVENYDKTITQAALVNTGHSGKLTLINLKNILIKLLNTSQNFSTTF